MHTTGGDAPGTGARDGGLDDSLLSGLRHRRVGVVVPVKSFRAAKSRLASELAPHSRRDLARALAERVVTAAHPHLVVVVCGDAEVASWAAERGAVTVSPPAPGLDLAVEMGIDALADLGVETVVVAHADLPGARGFDDVVAGPDEVVIVTDARRDGTNVLSFPLRHRVPAAYGPGSRARHEQAARDAGARVRVLDDHELSWDVDHPPDLEPSLRGLVVRPPVPHLDVPADLPTRS